MLAVELRPEERRRTLEDLVSTLKFSDLLLKLLDPLRLRRTHARRESLIHIGLPHPRADGLDPAAKLFGEELDSSRESSHRMWLAAGPGGRSASERERRERERSERQRA